MEDGTGRYLAVVPAWTSDEFVDFKRGLDMATKSAQENPILGRHHRGAKFRTRIVDPEYARYNLAAVPTPHLPRNAYREEWLATLAPWDLADLEPMLPVHDFSINVDDLVYRREYEPRAAGRV